MNRLLRTSLSLACLVCILLTANPSWSLPTDTWVIAIGNNHGEGDENGLLYAERDAQEVANAFRSLGGVPSSHVWQLADENADAVRQALSRVGQAIRASGSRETAIVVFYSGHADADRLHLGSTHLPFEELKSMVQHSGATFRLLVVDACRSGGVSRVKGVSAIGEFRVAVTQAVAEGTAIVTSSAANESSQESDKLRGSFFSHHWVQGLRGAADKNRDNEVTLSEAYAYAYEETVRSSGNTLELQHPTYSWNVKGRADVVLTRPGAASNSRLGRVRLGAAVTHLIYSGGGLVAEIHPPQGSALVALPPQRYSIQQRHPGEYRNYEVNLGAGQTVDLAGTSYQAVRYDRLVRKGGGDASISQGLFAVIGARGEIVEGEGTTPHYIAGYSLATRWFTGDARLRFSNTHVVDPSNSAPRRHEEYAVGLGLHRFIDLELASIAFGVVGEATWHRQVFTGGEGAPENRTSGSAGFGSIFSVERQLVEGLSLHLEGGPLATILKVGEAEEGRETRRTTAARVTWWLASGLIWRF